MSFVLHPIADIDAAGIDFPNAWKAVDEGAETHDSDASRVEFLALDTRIAVQLEDPLVAWDETLKLSLWFALRYTGPAPLSVFNDPNIGPITHPTLSVKLLLGGVRLVDLGRLTASSGTYAVQTVFVPNDLASGEETAMELQVRRLDSLPANEVRITAAEFRANTPSGRATAALEGSSAGALTLGAAARAYPLFGH